MPSLRILCEDTLLYGADIVDTAYMDNDGDGYSPADGDCDDDNADVNPGADETPGDGVDSNCDGEDDEYVDILMRSNMSKLYFCYACKEHHYTTDTCTPITMKNLNRFCIGGVTWLDSLWRRL